MSGGQVATSEALREGLACKYRDNLLTALSKCFLKQ